MLLYKACAAVEREVRWDDSNHVLFSNAEEAYEAFQHSLSKVCLDITPLTTGVLGYRIAFSGSGESNFRRKLYPEYKAGRSRKPLCYSHLLGLILDSEPASRVDTLEGDDLLGIWATNGKCHNPIIVSDDKDMRTVPGWLYRQGELTQVSKEQADYNWLLQTLTGDATDGYPGLPGCGPVTAEKLLNRMPDGPVDPEISHTEWRWDLIVQAYEAKGLTEDDALLQARLARILRASDWDSERKEVILWNP